MWRLLGPALLLPALLTEHLSSAVQPPDAASETVVLPMSLPEPPGGGLSPSEIMACYTNLIGSVEAYFGVTEMPAANASFFEQYHSLYVGVFTPEYCEKSVAFLRNITDRGINARCVHCSPEPLYSRYTRCSHALLGPAIAP